MKNNLTRKTPTIYTCLFVTIIGSETTVNTRSILGLNDFTPILP